VPRLYTYIEQAYKGNFHLLATIDGQERKFVIHYNMMELYDGTTINDIYVECQMVFHEKYFSMKGNDWRHLICVYVRKVTEHPELQEAEVFRYVMAG